MAAVTGLLAHRRGEILTSVVQCPCGASAVARRRGVLDTRNPALNTCLDLDFEATRASLIEHRPHRNLARASVTVAACVPDLRR